MIMKNKLVYSFDDEVVSKFCYDMDNKKIEVYFNGYFDLLKNEYVERPCLWVIENWSDAKSKLSSETKYDALENNLGIFSMVLFLENEEKKTNVTVNTLDKRYVDLVFIEPKISFS